MKKYRGPSTDVEPFHPVWFGDLNSWCLRRENGVYFPSTTPPIRTTNWRGADFSGWLKGKPPGKHPKRTPSPFLFSSLFFFWGGENISPKFHQAEGRSQKGPIWKLHGSDLSSHDSGAGGTESAFSTGAPSACEAKNQRKKLTRSSSRQARTRVPTVFPVVYFSRGTPPPQKKTKVKRHYWGPWKTKLSVLGAGNQMTRT